MLFLLINTGQWREVAKELEGVIRFGAVNCQEEWNLCRRQGIQSYPSLVFYPTVSLIDCIKSLCCCSMNDLEQLQTSSPSSK